VAQTNTVTHTRKLLSHADPNLIEVGREIRGAQVSGKFPEFCAAIGVHTRKAYDLITIADAVDHRLLTPNDVTNIGWSKARLVAKQSHTRRQARQAVAFATDNTLPALVAYLRGGGSGEVLITKSFHLTHRQASDLDAALKVAGVRMHRGRMENRTDALMVIIRAFRATTSRTPPRRMG
jgi:hypothetical protein